MKTQEFSDYDNQWKVIIEVLFEDFISYFLPDLYPQVDFSKKPQFLEKEFHKLVADKIKGKVYNDKLVSVYLKDGSQKWLLIHIEVQSFFEKDFARRMFIYFYRIFDKYDKEITAIAIFTGNKNPKKYQEFTYESYGTKLSYLYNTYKVMDSKETELLASTNPFALVVLACQYILQSKGNVNKRYAFKRKLLQLTLERNYSPKRIRSLLFFIVQLLKLPENLDIKLQQTMKESLNSSAAHEKYQKDLKAFDESMVDLFLSALRGTSLKELEESIQQAEKEKQQAEKEKQQAIKNLLKKPDFSTQEVAEIFNVSKEYVEKIKQEL